jgi:hypothetical protein
LKEGALSLVLQLYYAACDGGICKRTLGGSRYNYTVIIVGQKEGFFEVEVIIAELAQQLTAMQQDVVRSTALNPTLKNSLCIK